MEDSTGKYKIALTIIMVCAIFAICIVVTVMIPNAKNIDNIKEHIEEYTVFYNGEEVDGEHINIDDYKVSYDLDKKEVYLAPKNEKPATLVPLPM